VWRPWPGIPTRKKLRSHVLPPSLRLRVFSNVPESPGESRVLVRRRDPSGGPVCVSVYVGWCDTAFSETGGTNCGVGGNAGGASDDGDGRRGGAYAVRGAAAAGPEPSAAAADASGAAPTCIWMSSSASHCISSAVNDIGTALDVLQEVHVCILSSFSIPYMSLFCCNVLGHDRSIIRLRA